MKEKQLNEINPRVYIYYGLPHGKNGGFESRAQKEKEWWLKHSENEVILIPIKTEDDFIESWNNMGNNVKDVSLYFHSNPHNLILDYTTEDGEYITSYRSGRTRKNIGSEATWIGSLEKITIDSLVLYSCNSGHLDHLDDNLATAFLMTHDIDNISAWDGSMRWHRITGEPILARDQHYFETWRSKGSERKPKGLIRFYIKDGEIFFEPFSPKGGLFEKNGI